MNSTRLLRMLEIIYDMKLVFVLVDALKSLYLTEENMPFLYNLSKKGRHIKQIIPSPGFCERSEIFSGLDCYDTGNFTAIGYLPENSPYANDKVAIQIASLSEKICKKITRMGFQKWRLYNKRKLNPYRIPFCSLKYFALSEDGAKQLIPHRDIFDELRNHNKTYTLNAFTSLADLGPRTTKGIVDFITASMDESTYFIPYYIGTIDQVGHLYGNDIDSIRPHLQKVDKLLSEIFNLCRSRDYSFAVLGDHGMIPITQKINIMEEVQKLSCKHLRDYEVFYDSTTARFWLYNEDARMLIMELLVNKFSNHGIIINEGNYKDYRVPLDVISKSGKPIYGDIIWVANPGVLISPDYFHEGEIQEKGMHGYLFTNNKHSTGLFIASGAKITKTELSIDYSYAVCGELCDILEIPQPNINWKRILS